MGFLDKAKAKLTETVDTHGDKIAAGIDKAAKMANEKTGGKHADKIEKATGKARDVLDGLDGKNDDIPDADPRPEPGTNAPDPTAPDPTAQPGLPTDPSNPATG